MQTERIAANVSRVIVRTLHVRTPKQLSCAEGEKTVSARLRLSTTALARLLNVSGAEPEWILSSTDGSTTVKVRLAIAAVPDVPVTIGKGNIELDFARSLLSYQGRQATLTRMELRLLGALLEHAPNAVPKAHLVRRLWPSPRTCREAESALPVWVCALRRRLASLGIAGGIRTTRKLGYSLCL